MPIYEYRCVACQKGHEIIQKVNEEPLKICPACGGRLEKKMSLSGFQLKGGGWYKDGYTSHSDSGQKTEKKTEAKAHESIKPSTPEKPSPSAKPHEPAKKNTEK